MLGVYGGDGSVSRMAHLAREFDRTFLALPGGTFNHFPRAAGIKSVDLASTRCRRVGSRRASAS